MLLSGTELVILWARKERAGGWRCRGDSPGSGCTPWTPSVKARVGFLGDERQAIFSGVFDRCDLTFLLCFHPIGTAPRKPCKRVAGALHCGSDVGAARGPGTSLHPPSELELLRSIHVKKGLCFFWSLNDCLFSNPKAERLLWFHVCCLGRRQSDTSTPLADLVHAFASHRHSPCCRP